MPLCNRGIGTKVLLATGIVITIMVIIVCVIMFMYSRKGLIDMGIKQAKAIAEISAEMVDVEAMMELEEGDEDQNLYYILDTDTSDNQCAARRTLKRLQVPPRRNLKPYFYAKQSYPL